MTRLLGLLRVLMIRWNREVTILRARPTMRVRLATSRSSGAPSMLAGSASVALLLFGTRWGSYLGVGNILFLSDVLMAGAVVLTVIRSARHSPALMGGAKRTDIPWLILLAGGYATMRFLLGPDHSLTAIRDAVPYIYVLLGLLGFYAVRRSTPQQRRRTGQLLIAALALHALWFTVQLAFPNFPNALPVVSATQGLHVFSPRPDVDTTLIGVLAAYVLWRTLRFRKHVPLLVLAYLACWAPIGMSNTRAGVLGSAACSGFVLLIMLTDRRRSSFDRAGVAMLVFVAVLAGAGLLLTSAVGQKFVATVMPSTADTSVAAAGGAGTARARSEAWDQLVKWTFEDQTRATVGVGFGPDFLVDSGASLLLIHSDTGGDTVPRSPHNYWLGSMARLGVVGVIPIVLLTLWTLRGIWLSRKRARDEGFVVVASAVFIALIIPASLGVVLESPFGAIPFWWSAGVVLGVVTLRGAPSQAATVEARPAPRRRELAAR